MDWSLNSLKLVSHARNGSLKMMGLSCSTWGLPLYFRAAAAAVIPAAQAQFLSDGVVGHLESLEKPIKMVEML